MIIKQTKQLPTTSVGHKLPCTAPEEEATLFTPWQKLQNSDEKKYASYLSRIIIKQVIRLRTPKVSQANHQRWTLNIKENLTSFE